MCGGFLGDIVSNEISHTKNFFSDVGHDPVKQITQGLIGAEDPFGAKMWNTITGQHFTPNINQFGGETQAQYNQSAAQGINTGPAETMGHIADTVAGIWGAAGAAGALGGVGGAAGEGGTAALDASQVGALGSVSDVAGAGLTTEDVVGGIGAVGGVGDAAGGAAGASGSGISFGSGDFLTSGLTGTGGGATSIGGLGTTGIDGVGTGISSGSGDFLTSGLSGSSGVDWGSLGQLGSSLYNLYQGQQLKNSSNNLDPFGSYRAGFANQLVSLMNNPGSVTSLPGYKASQEAAQVGLTSQLASQGLTGSGTAAKAIATEGAQFENQYYQQQLQNLMQLSGANFNGSAAALQAQVAGTNAQSGAVNGLVKAIPGLISTGVSLFGG